MLCFGRNALTLKRGTACSLSIILPCGVGGIDQLESFGFRGRKSCIKNVEIFAVGKIAEFARFAGGERRKSPDRFSLIRAAASYGGRRIGFLVECSGAERRQDDNRLIPLAH